MPGPRYQLEIEVIEGEQSVCHQVGDTFLYPQDRSKLCPWLLDSLEGMARVLMFGGTLPWTYEGTPYKKEIDPEGVTTEYVRCPDPTAAGIVVKITRTPLPGPTPPPGL
jgi:uncharacterized repeat protein (TIGR04076 family)